MHFTIALCSFSLTQSTVSFPLHSSFIGYSSFHTFMSSPSVSYRTVLVRATNKRNVEISLGKATYQTDSLRQQQIRCPEPFNYSFLLFFLLQLTFATFLKCIYELYFQGHIYAHVLYKVFHFVYFFSFCSTKDPNTVFVSNLLFSVDEDRLKDVFSPVKITQ